MSGLGLDYSYGRIPVVFPATPYECGNMFGAFITSHLPDQPEHERQRKHNLKRQLRWWRLMTDIPVTVIASNWTDEKITDFPEFSFLKDRGGQVIRVPGQSLIHNRVLCLELLYESQFDWGIIMDDDAVLYHSPSHNSGGEFFAEMAENGPALYKLVDVFFPINPGKIGFTPIWAETPPLYRDNHVFQRNQDLKGSMSIVRNFPKFGRPPVLPSTSFQLHGEDTLFALEAIANGCTVHRCENIVLNELGSASHFPDRVAGMKLGNQRLVEMYGHLGLRMRTHPSKNHLLDRTEFISKARVRQPYRITVPKPPSTIGDA
jgi:hypothetical protein